MGAIFERNSHEGASLAWVGQYHSMSSQPHWHQECEIITCSDTCQVTIDDIMYIINPGQGIFLDSRMVHSIITSKDNVILNALIDNRLLRNIVSYASLKSPVFCDTYNARERLLDMYKELENKEQYYADCVNAMAIHLVAEIFRGEELYISKPSLPDKLTRYNALLKMIDEQHEFLTFSEAASYMNMTESYFSRYFKKNTGVTFSQYLNLVKVNQAISMINASPDISGTTLMIDCGFNTLRHLQRVFKIITGYTTTQLPSGYKFNIKNYIAHIGQTIP